MKTSNDHSPCYTSQRSFHLQNEKTNGATDRQQHQVPADPQAISTLSPIGTGLSQKKTQQKHGVMRKMAPGFLWKCLKNFYNIL